MEKSKKEMRVKTLEETIVRVRFLQSNGKYGRPKRVRKIKAEVTYLTKKDTLSYDKVEVEEYHTSMVRGSRIKIDPKTFITEWKKGETPQPKVRKDRDFNCKKVSLVYDYLKSTKEFENKKLTYKECRRRLETKEISSIR